MEPYAQGKQGNMSHQSIKASREKKKETNCSYFRNSFKMNVEQSKHWDKGSEIQPTYLQPGELFDT